MSTVLPRAAWHSTPAPFTPPPCTECQRPATMFISSNDAKVRAPRCDTCGPQVITELRARGCTFTVEIYGATEVVGWSFDGVARCLDHKPTAPDDWRCTPILRADYDSETCEVCRAPLVLPMGASR